MELRSAAPPGHRWAFPERVRARLVEKYEPLSGNVGAHPRPASRGLRVPEDVAVIGYDDIEDGAYSNPPVSTISPDKQVIATTAVERLLLRIASRTPLPGMELRAPHRLVARESTVGRVAAGGHRRPTGAA
ncbi:substrate-binding domain-containing protein [Micromonospora sp. SD12]|uniref:substrate-binding domain-containing protein n=1 Tax=Micromonospora sp. SD12 TaxID=3452216 RepID=UPI003F8A61D8